MLPAQGTAVYVPEKEALVWKIKSFPGGREFLLRAKFSLPSVAAEEEPHGRMPPIKVNFEIPYFTVSGIQVRSFFYFNQYFRVLGLSAEYPEKWRGERRKEHEQNNSLDGKLETEASSLPSRWVHIVTSD